MPPPSAHGPHPACASGEWALCYTEQDRLSRLSVLLQGGMCSVYLKDSEKVVSISSEHLEPITPTKNNKVEMGPLGGQRRGWQAAAGPDTGCHL